MAKRRAAEPLTFHVPWKRLLLCDLPEEPPPLWIPPPGGSSSAQPRGAPEPPRKRKIDAGAMAEALASPSKRRDGGDPRAPGGGEPEGRGLDSGGPPRPLRLQGPGEEPRGVRPPRGGGDGAGRGEPPRGDWGSSPPQLREEFWQYNTFQYWRNPLPPLDLADIEAVNQDKLTEAKLRDRNEEPETAMES